VLVVYSGSTGVVWTELLEVTTGATGVDEVEATLVVLDQSPSSDQDGM